MGAVAATDAGSLSRLPFTSCCYSRIYEFHDMEHGIAEKLWIDLHASLSSDCQQLYTPPLALPALISELLHSPPTAVTAASSTSYKLNPAARKASTVPTAAAPQPPYPSSALFHCKFAYDAGGYLLLISDWMRVWYHRATAEQVQLEKAEFAEQVALSTADEAITRIVQPLLTGPPAQRLHAVSFQPSSQLDAAQPVLWLTSSMEMGLFRLRWRFECRPFLSSLHQSSLLLHLTLLPQQAMVTQLHAQLTAARSGQQEGSTRVKEEVRAAKDRHEPNGASRIAASQSRSQHVASSRKQVRSPSPIASPPSVPVVKSEESAVPTLESLYEQSMRASQSQSQSQAEDAVEAEAAQAQAAEEQKEAQKGADGEGYWDEAKQEWVQGEKERERLEKAKQSHQATLTSPTSSLPTSSSPS